jgi:hypothetical protein
VSENLAIKIIDECLGVNGFHEGFNYPGF